MKPEDMIVVPTVCGECPLWRESGYGSWCGHPKVIDDTESDPFAKRVDGGWRTPDWNKDDTMPERCPLKRFTVIVSTKR